MKAIQNQNFYLIPSSDILKDPFWDISIKLHQIEKDLLKLKCLRRLHFIHHGGISYLHSHYIHSRMQHTLSVFALTCYFKPQDLLLRIAALLHDIGHAPFSHSIEQIKGIDHHQLTQYLITEGEVAASVLKKYQISSSKILSLIEGQITTILRNNQGYLHLDHLDSWIRSADMTGLLTVSPHQILKKIYSEDQYLQTDEETATLLFECIISEAQIHSSKNNLVANALLAYLVNILIQEKVISLDQIKFMTDNEVESQLLNHHSTKDLSQKLFYEIESFNLSKNFINDSTPYITSHLRKFYLSMPLINNIPFDKVRPSILSRIEQMKTKLGTYYISI